MKRILLILVSMVFFLAGFSQNLALEWKHGPIANGDIIDVSGSIDTLIYVDIELKNIGTTAVEAKVWKRNIVEVPGSMNTFCFAAQCSPGSDTVSLMSVTLSPGASDHSFVGDYYPLGNPGVSTYMYTFFNVNDYNDTVSVTVRFSGTVGISAEAEPVTLLSRAWPNPASDRVFFEYNIQEGSSSSYVLSVRDMAGRSVREVHIPLGQGVVEVDISDIENGIYFYSLVNSNQVILTRKLVIKR